MRVRGSHKGLQMNKCVEVLRLVSWRLTSQMMSLSEISVVVLDQL